MDGGGGAICTDGRHLTMRPTPSRRRTLDDVLALLDALELT